LNINFIRMNTKFFAFPQPSLAKVNLFQDQPHGLDTSNYSKNKPPKSSSVPVLQAKQHYTTIVLNKASKGGPELNLDILHLGGGKKTPMNVSNVTPDPTQILKDILNAPKTTTSSSRNTVQNRTGAMMLNSTTTRNGPMFNLPNLNLNATTTMNSNHPTSFEIFKSLIDPMNEIRGIEGVRFKERESVRPITSHRGLKRKNTQPIENTTKINEEEEVEIKVKPIVLKPKLDMPLILDGGFRKEQERKSNKLTKRSNTGNFSQDGDDESELSTAQLFHHHMEEKGNFRPKSLALIDNLHFRKNIKKIFRSQDHGKESQRSIEEHLNTGNTSIHHDLDLKKQTKIPSKIDLSTADSQEESLQGWNCIRPVRIPSEKATARSQSNQGKVQDFAIKTYKNGVFRSKKRVVKCVTDIDRKIARISKKDRTLEQNILSPLNESSSSEDENFAEYVEAIKSQSEEILHCM